MPSSQNNSNPKPDSPELKPQTKKNESQDQKEKVAQMAEHPDKRAATKEPDKELKPAAKAVSDQLSTENEAAEQPPLDPFTAFVRTLRLNPNTHTVDNLLGEKERRIYSLNTPPLVIKNPVALVRRIGGSTHRVYAMSGEVYCYAAPETGKTVLSWTPRPGAPAVTF